MKPADNSRPPIAIDYVAYPDGRDPYADSTTDVMRMAWLADELEKEGKMIHGGRIIELEDGKNNQTNAPVEPMEET